VGRVVKGVGRGETGRGVREQQGQSMMGGGQWKGFGRELTGSGCGAAAGTKHDGGRAGGPADGGSFAHVANASIAPHAASSAPAWGTRHDGAVCYGLVPVLSRLLCGQAQRWRAGTRGERGGFLNLAVETTTKNFPGRGGGDENPNGLNRLEDTT
jgi:hypothetical protein